MSGEYIRITVETHRGETTVRSLDDYLGDMNDVQAYAEAFANVLVDAVGRRQWVPQVVAGMILEIQSFLDSEGSGDLLPRDLIEAAATLIADEEKR